MLPMPLARTCLLLLAAALLATPAQAQPRPPAATPPAAAPPPSGPPHAWLFGVWTGGLFPPGDTDGPTCAGAPTVIFTRDVVMRSSPIDIPFRQRMIETVASQPDGVEFRFTPASPTLSAFGAQPPGRDSAFGCANPNALRVERRGEDEIIFPNCSEFPAALKRCR